MDKFSKMITIRTLFLMSFCIMYPSIAAGQFDSSKDIPHIHLNSSDNCRQKRGADDEDVINRFEMERVQPLFEIVRHLPPFDDNWLSSPVTIPPFPSFPSIKLENESSSYDEYKIEVIKDEEHVVGENGKQFKENSALNWYYSAESYSSVNNFTKHDTDVLKTELNTARPIMKTLPTISETTIPKTSILRKHDDDHVVSHVPSLNDGRGTFLDINLLGSSTTPNVDSTTPPKSEEIKPNITTRYILLQSGRVVAINVTSVSTALKPTSMSGTGNKNPYLPTVYFGSRIRNKNASVASSNRTSTQNSLEMPTTKASTGKQTTDHRVTQTLQFTKSNQLKVNALPTESPDFYNKTTSGLLFDRKSTTYAYKSVTITPNVEYFKPQKKLVTHSAKSFTITPHVEYSKLKQNSSTSRTQQLKQLSVTPELKQVKKMLSTTLIPPQVTKESSTLDPAQKWWSEMKAAKKERMALYATSVKPRITTKAPGNPTKIVTNNFETTVTDSLYSKVFDSMKKTSREAITPSTFELTGNARSAKLRMTEKQALHFSTTAASARVIRTPSSLLSPRWSTFSPLMEIIPKIGKTSTKRAGEDLLEPSVPQSEVRHDFVRIVTLSSLDTATPTVKYSVTTVKPVQRSPGSSRRPRYRGLSHVNLQSPKQQRIESSTIKAKEEIRGSTFPSNYQLTTNTYRRPVNYQWWNIQTTTVASLPTIQPLTTPPIKKSRPAFYLRNSVQTIPPNSLTDRRTLTSEAPNYDVTVVESLQPPLVDLLIISFEPTRKSMGSQEKYTEKSSPKQEKQHNHRETAKPNKRTSTLIHNQERFSLTTSKPHKKFSQTSPPNIRPIDQASITSRSGNREGRHFRNNSPRFQSIDEKVSTLNPNLPTTKQPFRVYYFEPKRRRSKDSNESLKNETRNPVPLNAEKSLRSHAQRTSSTNRGIDVSRSRGVQNIERPNNTRQTKHLQLLAREITSSTNAPTTLRPSTKRFRSSPFIWHRPNVGTVKPVA